MKKRYIHRQIESVIKKAARQFPAVAVTGPRQSGKSTLLREIFSDTHDYFTFDDLINREQAISDPKLFLSNISGKAIIDEIQYAPQLLSYVKMLIDNDREEKGRFIFTGSQQFALIKNLGDSLAGRIALFDLLPFSVNEIRSVQGMANKLDTTLKCFVNSCLFGYFPEIAVDSSVNVNTWYGAYLRTYLERDVRTTYNVGKLRDFQSFLQLLASRCSQILNLSSFSNDLGVGVNTIKRWLSILEAGRIIYLLPPYYQNFGKRVTKSPKVYFLDCGLVCYLMGIKNSDLLLKGPMAGQLFENFYIQETIKSFFNSGLRPRAYYLHLPNRLEIDLLLENSNRNISLMEIKFTKTPRPSMASSIKKFKKTFPKLTVNDARILSISDDSMELVKDVLSHGIDDYLKYLI